jgi:hypothetical protein
LIASTWGSGGGLLQQIDHALEAVVRMMQENVALADRGEQVGMFAQHLGDRRRRRGDRASSGE